MKIERGMIWTLGVAALSACAAGAGAGGAANPSASALPEVTCNGTPPVATTYARASQDALNRTLVARGDAATPLYQQALQQAQSGMAADATNPYHYFLAGRAQAGLGNLAAADSMFDRAEQLCSGFASDINEERRAAYATSFKTGADALTANDTASAIAAFSRAGAIYDRDPNVFFNLGVLYGATGDEAKSLEAYRATLAVMDRAEADTTAEARAALAETRANALAGMVNAGVRAFQANRFDDAIKIFRGVTAVDANNRDAWYNLGLAYYKAERWQDLIPVEQRVIQIDPLNENARIILYNAYKSLADRAKSANDAAADKRNRDLAVAVLTELDAMPIKIDNVQVANPQAGSARITGTATGAKAAAGRPIVLEVTAYGASGKVGAQNVTIAAPAKDATANFDVTVPVTAPASSFSYRVVQQ